MIILGIHDGHCASAALIIDNKLVAAISEERIVRKKMEWCFPENAVKECLRIGKIKIEDVDKVAFSSFHIAPKLYLTRREATFSLKDWIKEQNLYWYPKFYKKKNVSYIKVFEKNTKYKKFPYQKKFIKNEDDVKGMLKARLEHAKSIFNKNNVPIEVYDHQECHAYHVLSFVKNRNKKKLIFTIDGAGDGANATCWIYDPKKNFLNQVIRTDKCVIGRLYRFITLLLGMLPVQHEYKVMGLAPYAKPEYANEANKIFNEILTVNNCSFVFKKKIKDLYFYFKEKLQGYRFDIIAYSLQSFTEEIISKWVSNVSKKYGIKDICLSGGVAQNIKCNQKISELKNIDNVFVGPGSGDEGLAIGAAFRSLSQENLSIDKNFYIKNAYLGNEFSDNEIKKEIAKLNKKKLTVEKFEKNKIINLLIKGEVVGRFCGKMEFGPRALGNRSIIADPRNKNVIQKINEVIKERDFWMPFAPSILKEKSKKYIINKKNLDSSYMTIGLNTTQIAKDCLQAAIHSYDKTARPHLVTRENNQQYYDLIKAFERKTGVSSLLNTSFNLHGEPIVCTPSDAIKTFLKSGLRNLIIENYIIRKKK